MVASVPAFLMSLVQIQRDQGFSKKKTQKPTTDGITKESILLVKKKEF